MSFVKHQEMAGHQINGIFCVNIMLTQTKGIKLITIIGLVFPSKTRKLVVWRP